MSISYVLCVASVSRVICSYKCNWLDEYSTVITPYATGFILGTDLAQYMQGEEGTRHYKGNVTVTPVPKYHPTMAHFYSLGVLYKAEDRISVV